MIRTNIQNILRQNDCASFAVSLRLCDTNPYQNVLTGTLAFLSSSISRPLRQVNGHDLEKEVMGILA